ncbi:MAG: hypothetical protein J6M41_09490 [Prevotella sp.]|nr:hypothetical protein [Prevotella sp.]
MKRIYSKPRILVKAIAMQQLFAGSNEGPSPAGDEEMPIVGNNSSDASYTINRRNVWDD